jgi:hypothetical protein
MLSPSILLMTICRTGRLESQHQQQQQDMHALCLVDLSNMAYKWTFAAIRGQHKADSRVESIPVATGLPCGKDNTSRTNRTP